MEKDLHRALEANLWVLGRWYSMMSSIKFKRPSHDITRDDISQAEQYRDDLSNKLSSTAKMDIMTVGRGRAATIDTRNLLSNIIVHSDASLISTARSDLDWLLASLSRQS